MSDKAIRTIVLWLVKANRCWWQMLVTDSTHWNSHHWWLWPPSLSHLDVLKYYQTQRKTKWIGYNMDHIIWLSSWNLNYLQDTGQARSTLETLLKYFSRFLDFYRNPWRRSDRIQFGFKYIFERERLQVKIYLDLYWGSNNWESSS